MSPQKYGILACGDSKPHSIESVEGFISGSFSGIPLPTVHVPRSQHRKHIGESFSILILGRKKIYMPNVYVLPRSVTVFFLFYGASQVSFLIRTRRAPPTGKLNFIVMLMPLLCFGIGAKSNKLFCRSRATEASQWAILFCSEAWSDECRRCFRPVGKSNSFSFSVYAANSWEVQKRGLQMTTKNAYISIVERFHLIFVYWTELNDKILAHIDTRSNNSVYYFFFWRDFSKVSYSSYFDCYWVFLILGM